MEGFAFPDEIRMAKCFIPFVFCEPIILWEIAYCKAVLWLYDCPKTSFISLHYNYLDALDQGATPLD